MHTEQCSFLEEKEGTEAIRTC